MALCLDYTEFQLHLGISLDHLLPSEFDSDKGHPLILKWSVTVVLYTARVFTIRAPLPAVALGAYASSSS